MTTANQRHAQRCNADQKAYALAEAGINNAVAAALRRYPSVNKSGNGGASLIATPQQYTTGTVGWTASYDTATDRWLLIGTGAVPNPAGGTP